jgi:hypothetical protein
MEIGIRSSFEERFNLVLERDNTHKSDVERRAMFYILAGNDDLYRKINYIYDFEDRSIEVDCLENGRADFSGSSQRLVRLAFNLYNGFPAEVLDSFQYLDEDNFNLAMGAIKIRFGFIG